MRHGLVDRDAGQGTVLRAGGQAHITVGHDANDDAVAINDWQESAVAIAHDGHDAPRSLSGAQVATSVFMISLTVMVRLLALRTRFATVVPQRRLQACPAIDALTLGVPGIRRTLLETRRIDSPQGG